MHAQIKGTAVTAISPSLRSSISSRAPYTANDTARFVKSCGKSTIRSFIWLVSDVSRYTRSPVRMDSWNDSDSRCRCANTRSRMSAVIRSPVPEIQNLLTYENSASRTVIMTTDSDSTSRSCRGSCGST